MRLTALGRSGERPIRRVPLAFMTIRTRLVEIPDLLAFLIATCSSNLFASPPRPRPRSPLIVFAALYRRWKTSRRSFDS